MRNKRFTNLFLLIYAVTCVLTACSGDSDKKQGTARGASTSAPYELMVVANKDWLKTAGGQSVNDLIYANMPCTPQPEPWLRATIVEPHNFKGVFQNYSNILMVDVSSKYKNPDFHVAYNVYAKPQTVITLCAPTDAAMTLLCELHYDEILDLFNRAEDQRAQQRLRKRYSKVVQTQAKKQFQCLIYAPEELNAIKKGKDFFWASSQGQHEQYWNLCMYAYPYTSSQTFTLDYFIEKRDSFMRANIQGEDEGSYMSSDRRTLQSRNITVNNHYVQEVRGLWQMEHAAMGGPFISYAQVDTVNNRVLVAEGFVYAPNKKKHDFIRQLEAALQTLQLPSAQQ